MKLIDADAIEYKESIIDTDYQSTDDVIIWHEKRKLKWVSKEDIDKQPTIDAESVVRCKDCKFNYANQIPSGDECQLCVELPISKDFFCAYGEKMDEVNNEDN